LNPILSQFASRIAQAVERFTITRIEKAVREQSRSLMGRRASGGLRPTVRCYFPGCKNVAAPRFGMFCVALHKGLSKAEKDRYRAAYLAQRDQAKTGGRAASVAARVGRRAKTKPA
jgi:hypothetical protein